MDQSSVSRLCLMAADRLPVDYLPTLQQHLEAMDPSQEAMAMGFVANLKNPMVTLLLSIFLGHLGIDRFYIGDTGLGVLKLITLGGCSVWWLFDIFLTMDKTREANRALAEQFFGGCMA